MHCGVRYVWEMCCVTAWLACQWQLSDMSMRLSMRRSLMQEMTSRVMGLRIFSWSSLTGGQARDTDLGEAGVPRRVAVGGIGCRDGSCGGTRVGAGVSSPRRAGAGGDELERWVSMRESESKS